MVTVKNHLRRTVELVGAVENGAVAMHAIGAGETETVPVDMANTTNNALVFVGAVEVIPEVIPTEKRRASAPRSE